MNINGVETFDENILLNFHNLTELNCANCPNITDKGIQKLVLLTELDCGYCENITKPSSRLATRGKLCLLINSCYSS